MDGRYKKYISRGSEVYIVLKKDQRSGKKTHGFVQDILTNSEFHPYGIKVRLSDGKIGRVKSIIN